ncbi:MAG TPA: hypothetical protein VM689_20800 [Aliidongia sp.]|nr:hypothetical protein [Aliidongia sp.]
MNHPTPQAPSRRDGFTATCAALQPGFSRFVLPVMLACAALLVLDCTTLRHYLAHAPLVSSIAAPMAEAVETNAPWIPGDIELQTADPVTSAKTLATLFGLIIFMTATSVFLCDTTLRIGGALHKRNQPKRQG